MRAMGGGGLQRGMAGGLVRRRHRGRCHAGVTSSSYRKPFEPNPKRQDLLQKRKNIWPVLHCFGGTVVGPKCRQALGPQCLTSQASVKINHRWCHFMAKANMPSKPCFEYTRSGMFWASTGRCWLRFRFASPESAPLGVSIKQLPPATEQIPLEGTLSGTRLVGRGTGLDFASKTTALGANTPASRTKLLNHPQAIFVPSPPPRPLGQPARSTSLEVNRLRAMDEVARLLQCPQVWGDIPK